MQVQLQKCNVCGAVNTTNDGKWVRIFGVTLGASLIPIQPRNQIDVCPACAATTTADKLPGIAGMAARIPMQLGGG